MICFSEYSLKKKDADYIISKQDINITICKGMIIHFMDYGLLIFCRLKELVNLYELVDFVINFCYRCF